MSVEFMSLSDSARHLLNVALKTTASTLYGRENCCTHCGMPIEIEGYCVRTEATLRHFCGLTCQQIFIKRSEMTDEFHRNEI